MGETSNEVAKAPARKLYARFDDEGRPAWIGFVEPKPEDCEYLPEWMKLHDAATMRRVDGEWVMRRPPAPPTEEELRAYEAELARNAAETAAREAEEAERAIMDEVFRRSMPDMHLRSSGKITIAQYNARFAEIEAAVRAGD